MDAVLRGVIDTHVHTSPDAVSRRYSDLELAELASGLGVAAIVIKSHLGDTAARAADCNEYLARVNPGGGTQVFGGVALNYPVGGLNLKAVEVSAALGGKVIWLPTADAANDREKHGKTGGIRVTGPDGELCPQAKEILAFAREHGLILATGHLSPPEIFALAREAAEQGFGKLVITHPEYWVVGLTHAQQRELAGVYGASLERCYRQPMPDGVWADNVEDTLRLIDEIGWEHIIAATDGGQPVNPPWDSELRDYIGRLSAHLASPEAVRHMTAELPAKLLGITL